jgi:hypothetical protein
MILQTVTTAPRNSYGALTIYPDFIKALLREAETAGAWTTGIESDKKKRGSAINVDVYGYDSADGLAIVQVREAVFHPRRYTRVRKDYYLIGHTESGNFFAHPVASPARSSQALDSPRACVRWVLAKIWQCREDELEDIERQGDVAFIPVRSCPKGAIQVTGPVRLRDSHELTGEIWTVGDTYYVRRGARLVHLKRQHKTVKAREGWYRVQVGIREEVWGFTAPKGD